MTSRETTPRERRFLDRRRRILDLALELAEAEGWEAVTTRRLAEAIDYSQPVIYQHFATRDDLVRTIVLEGFVALGERIARVADASAAPLEDACRAYLAFGSEHPRLYEAMFTQATTLAFDAADTPLEMRRAFEALAALVAREAPTADHEAAAELFWACCHGLVTLHRAGRIPAERLEQHIRATARLVR